MHHVSLPALMPIRLAEVCELLAAQAYALESEEVGSYAGAERSTKNRRRWARKIRECIEAIKKGEPDDPA